MFARRLALSGLVGVVLMRALPAKAAPVEISIDNYAFMPEILKVATGTMVTFTNRDDMPHTVVSTAMPPLFKSKPLDTGDSFSFSFDKPGRYMYFCGLHPYMKGTVEVA